MGGDNVLTMAVTFLPNSVSTKMTFPAVLMMFPHTGRLCLPKDDTSDPSSDPQSEHFYPSFYYTFSVFGCFFGFCSFHFSREIFHSNDILNAMCKIKMGILSLQQLGPLS